MASTAKKVVVKFDGKDEKKNVVKYTSEDEAVGSIYISKIAVKKLGDPEEITVTIEPA
jgi:hypothetical protein